MLDNFKETFPDGVSETLDLALLQNTLIRLAREGICVRDLFTIIEHIEAREDYEVLRKLMAGGEAASGGPLF